MSVEKHPEETAAVAMTEQQSDGKIDHELTGNEEVTESQLSESSGRLVKENAVLAQEDEEQIVDVKKENDDENNNVRNWFAKLSSLDRCAALGFVDGRFLTTLIVILQQVSASSSPRDQQSEEQQQRDNNADISFDWTMTFDLDNIERVYDSVENKIYSLVVESGMESDESSSPSHGAGNGASRTKKGCTEEEKAEGLNCDMPADDAYRIRNKDASKDKCYDLSKSLKILEQCYAVFPSSFNSISGKMIDDNYPYVTIETANSDGNNNVDTLFSFDCIACACFEKQFLCDKIDIADSKSWIRRLEMLNSGRDVPLYAMLLARLEQAVHGAYFGQQRQSSIQQHPIGHLTKEADTQEVTREVNCALTSSEGCNVEAVTASNDMLESTVTPMLNDIFCHSRAVDDLTLTMDSLILSYFMEPFVEAFGLTNVDPIRLKPRVLSATPLTLVMRAANSSHLVDYQKLDQAVRLSLRRMHDHGSETKQVLSDNEQPVNATCTFSDRSEEIVNTGAVMKEAAVHDFPVAGVAPTFAIAEEENPILDLEEAFNSKEVQQKPNHTKSMKKKKKKSKKKKNRKTAGNSKDLHSAPTEEPFEETSKVEEDIVEAEDAVIEELSEAEILTEKEDLKACRLPARARSFDSADSTVTEKATVRSETSTPNVDARTEKTENITISQNDGSIIVASLVVGSTSGVSGVNSEVNDSPEKFEAEEKDDGDLWETVEFRSKANRKKGGDRVSHGNSRHIQHASSTVSSSADSQGGSSRKTKGSRTPASRKKNASRKMVRDILFSVVDVVDEESRKKKVIASAPRPVGNPWKNGPPGKVAVAASVPLQKNVSEKTPEPPKKEKTLRDVVLGTHSASQQKNAFPGTHLAIQKSAVANSVVPAEKRLSRVDEAAGRESSQKAVDVRGKNLPTKRVKGQVSAVADQNTAPTYQETVSAVSTISNVAVGSKENILSEAEKISKSDSSYAGTDEAPQKLGREPLVVADNDSSPVPPLPTLLSPENANSSTSSVASSLEAPHVVHTHHHTKSTPSTNDVGYHLLDVCDKLSRDMSLFMSRRALALSPRRRERCDLLAALQSSVSSLWPSRCHVELYGSCAIQLDLPSSDLDVVVVGLDRNLDIMRNQGVQVLDTSAAKSFSSDSIEPSASQDENSVSKETQQLSMHHLINPYVMMAAHINGDRVMRLAAELESQPWAVQVKAIPTASVPVVKILADPSRLNLASNGGDWVPHHQHVPSQAEAGSEKSQVSDSDSVKHVPSSISTYNPQTAFLPWRGSDIVKGLLALDITFEGPEHGGIGSTEFSSRVIAEACLESGLPPDSTPFVQVLMVLKELLAQRKLNEPYSGGLSSYALLLLILALVRERAFVREEIERVEQQRKAMAAVDAASFVQSSVENSRSSQSLDVSSASPIHQPKDLSKTANETSSTATSKSELQPPKPADSKDSHHGIKHPKKQQGKPATQSISADGITGAPNKHASNSWANIAKKSAGNKASSKASHNATQHRGTQPSSSQLQYPQHPQPQHHSAHHNNHHHKLQNQNNHHHNNKHHHGKKTAKASNEKPSFADAVANTSSIKPNSGQPHTSAHVNTVNKPKNPTLKDETIADKNKPSVAVLDSAKDGASTNGAQIQSTDSVTHNLYKAANDNPMAYIMESSLVAVPSFYPQGVNDIIEVLCSGETTAGKLLMHFLLFYGQYFDAQTTAIDISGKHARDLFVQGMPTYSQHMSPFIQRRSPGRIDPVTGMLIVDPIVVYDPLEGAENNNVAKRCFAWNSVRWIFSQSYATLSSAVERSATPPTSPSGKSSQGMIATNDGRQRDPRFVGACNPEAAGNLCDPSSPLLSCLLSF